MLVYKVKFMLISPTTLPAKKNICYFCNIPGHWIQKCPI
jgi:hypothetical protein